MCHCLFMWLFSLCCCPFVPILSIYSCKSHSDPNSPSPSHIDTTPIITAPIAHLRHSQAWRDVIIQSGHHSLPVPFNWLGHRIGDRAKDRGGVVTREGRIKGGGGRTELPVELHCHFSSRKLHKRWPSHLPRATRSFRPLQGNRAALYCPPLPPSSARPHLYVTANRSGVFQAIR